VPETWIREAEVTILCDTPVAMRSILGTEPERDERGKGMGEGEEGSVEPLFVMFLAEVSESVYLIFLKHVCVFLISSG